MLTPQLLCDTYTLFKVSAVASSDPFGESAAVSVEATVLTRVRLSQSSGDRSVDARGDASARQAVLFFFSGVSRADGRLDLPVISAGDRIAEGSLTAIPTSGRVWTVKGVPTLKAMSRVHHLEVSLV